MIRPAQVPLKPSGIYVLYIYIVFFFEEIIKILKVLVGLEQVLPYYVK